MKLKILLFTIMFILILPSQVLAKDYSIPTVSIKAVINQDGNFSFYEERTFSFDGSFSFGFYDLPRQGFKTLYGVQVLEDGNPLINETSKNAGTFYIEEFPDKYRIHYFYNAYYEKKTFTFIFTAKEAVKVYEDYGEFYWKLQGSGWERPVGDFSAEIELVQPVPVDDFLVWAHGPLWGEIKKLNEQKILVKVLNVPSNTFVEARILIPSSYFVDAIIKKGVIKDKVLKEEGSLVRRANRIRFILKSLPFLSLLIFAVLLIIFFRVYSKYGLEFNIPKNFIYYREPPSKMTPAIVGSILSFNKFKPSFLQATILDLLRKGYIEMEEIPKKQRRNDYLLKLVNNHFGKLEDFEQLLLNRILFDKSPEVIISQLPKKMQSNKTHYKYVFDDFIKKINNEVIKNKYFDTKSEKISWVILGVGIFLMFITLPLAAILHPSFTILYISGVTYILGGIFAIPRRTTKGKEEFDKWLGFKSFLKDFSNLKEYGPKSIIIWEEYLVYATVFGVAKNVLKVLKITFPQINDIDKSRIFAFTSLSSGMPASNINQAFSSLNSAFSSLGKVASISYSSSSGGGGGFSGGGGGGGGGSGGGVG